jgi:hypothetical protein
VRNWFKRSTKVTADTARRITGISTPLGGMQWADPGPSDAEMVRQFLVFLEDRRVLYNAMQLEVLHQVEHSIHEIREEYTRTLQRLGSNAFAVQPIRTIREAGRRFHDDCNEEFRHLAHDWDGPRHHRHGAGPGFFTALGAYRATVGYQVALLAAHYDVDVEGDLASVIPGANGDLQG